MHNIHDNIVLDKGPKLSNNFVSLFFPVFEVRLKLVPKKMCRHNVDIQ